MVAYLFIFGRTPKLAFTELTSLYPQSLLITDDVAVLQVTCDFPVHQAMMRLGGTVKIAKVLGHEASLDASSLEKYLVAENNDVIFGISFYGMRDPPKSLDAECKNALKKQGINARYVHPKDGCALSSVSIDKNKVQELIVIKDTHVGYTVSLTIEVQPYEDWGARDYRRPFADPRMGMLPPKIARMIVNIANPGNVRTSHEHTPVLLDPFCGMGTILAEAYMTGWEVWGSDTSGDAVAKCYQNLDWLSRTYTQPQGTVKNIEVCDAVHVSQHHAPVSFDAIVTEPYLGKTNIVIGKSVNREHIRNMIKGLEKLYIGCLKDWHSILKPDGKVVIAFPSYDISGHFYSVKKVIDMCENLGYTIDVGPIAYFRPHAIVRREFYVLKVNYGTR